MADIPPNAGTGTHDRLLDWREAEARVRERSVTFKAGDLQCRAGFEQAIKQATELMEEEARILRATADNLSDYAEEMCQLGGADALIKMARVLRNIKPGAPR